jgi:hypothetical protein
MSTTSILPGPRATAAFLVIAPLGALLEAVFSPLRGGSTADDVRHVAAHQGLFVATVLLGLASTLLFIPAFLGLADACRDACPRLATFAGWVMVGAMCGFVAVRTLQSVELQSVREGFRSQVAARLVDHAGFGPIVAPLFVLFLGGALVGLVCLAIAAWRTGFPRPACVLLALFQVIDFAIPARPTASHLILLVALAWLAVTLWARPGGTGSPLVEATRSVAL